MGHDVDAAAPSVADRMFVVLEVCATATRPLSLAELVERTDLPKTTLHRVCWKLVGLGALEHADGGFRIGTKLFALGSMSPEVRRLRAASMPYLQDLCVRSGWVANLAVLSDRRVLLVEEVYGPTPAVPKMIGATMALHATAVGKALLAGRASDRIEALLGPGGLRAFTRYTIVRRPLLLSHLAEAAEAGVATSREEWRMGTSGVAAPVVVDGEVIAALALIGPPDDEALRRLSHPVRRAAAGLASALAPVPAIA